MGTIRQEDLPTFQSDTVEKRSFKVNYSRSAAVDESDEIDTVGSLSRDEISEQHRNMILKAKTALQREIAEKRSEAVAIIGENTYKDMMAFLKAKVESEELMNMGQDDLNSFMLSRIPAKDTPVMGVLYQIIELDIQLADCEAKLKLVDEVLRSG